MITHRRLLVLALLAALLCAPQRAPAAAPLADPTADPPQGCVTTGWDPQKVNLKDHSVFFYRGVYYIVAIAIAPDHYEDRFAYARSVDMCHWENMGLILRNDYAPPWDSWRIWAPFVIAEGDTYYMFYTGVTKDVTQSIMLATSTNPADPLAWQPRGLAFQPNHAGMNWPGLGKWSDARDPTVLKVGDRYYMYYTGGDAGGGIVGAASASSLLGPWQDLGATLTLPGAMPESAGVFTHNGLFYLFYHRVNVDATGGSELRVGATPLGPWAAPQPITPGWAHEFWQDANKRLMVSYLEGYTISIRPVVWDEFARPAQLLIDRQLWHLWLPISTKAAPRS